MYSCRHVCAMYVRTEFQQSYVRTYVRTTVEILSALSVYTLMRTV